MATIYVKMRDKNNSHWIPTQNVSLSGSKVIEVEKDEFVSKSLRQNVIVEATEKEFEEFSKGVEPTKDEVTETKRENFSELFNKALEKDIIKKTEDGYFYKEELIGADVDASIEYLTNSKELVKAIKKAK